MTPLSATTLNDIARIWVVANTPDFLISRLRALSEIGEMAGSLPTDATVGAFAAELAQQCETDWHAAATLYGLVAAASLVARPALIDRLAATPNTGAVRWWLEVCHVARQLQPAGIVIRGYSAAPLAPSILNASGGVWHSGAATFPPVIGTPHRGF